MSTDGTKDPSWAGMDGFQRLQEALARAERTPEEAIFTTLFAPEMPQEGPLNGSLISVKALFDVAGIVTHSGSAVRRQRPAATSDAEVVAQLRRAGASLIGQTNMTEFAYSGLGLNPHFGTPQTPLFPGAIAGGSSSGAAASVARHYADIGLASDTGGSARIPAAFCGLVGWKPTANRLSRNGMVPLSFSLDGVGLIGRDLCDVAAAFFALSPQRPFAARRPRLLVPEGFGLNDLAPEVAAGFENALDRLSRAGWQIRRFARRHTQAYLDLPVWRFAAVESRALHSYAWNRASELDPNVARRMQRADEISATGYAATLHARGQLIDQISTALDRDILVLPTVAILPPQMESCLSPQEFDRLNAIVLRNTSFANVIDGCSLSLPLKENPGVGFMLTAVNGHDEQLLAAAMEIEATLNSSVGCAHFLPEGQ